MTEERKQMNFEIGERVRAAREDAGLTQERLAEMVDLSVQYISDLERGCVGASVPTIIRLCRCLHASCDYILMGRERNEEIADLIETQRLKKLSPEHQRSLANIINIVLDALGK